jgi:hypothetical protein
MNPVKIIIDIIRLSTQSLFGRYDFSNSDISERSQTG